MRYFPFSPQVFLFPTLPIKIALQQKEIEKMKRPVCRMRGAHQLIVRWRSSCVARSITSAQCNDKKRRYFCARECFLIVSTWKSSPSTLVSIGIKLLQPVGRFKRIHSQFTVIFWKWKDLRYWKDRNRKSADIITITLEIWNVTYFKISILDYLEFGKSHVQLFNPGHRWILQVRSLFLFPASPSSFRLSFI